MTTEISRTGEHLTKGDIESLFNRLTGTPRSRPIYRRTADLTEQQLADRLYWSARRLEETSRRRCADGRIGPAFRALRAADRIEGRRVAVINRLRNAVAL